MATPAVIGIGHVTCDIICPLEDWPAPDTKTVIPEITLAGGGPTANAMAALARLGVTAGLVGRLGDDLLGRYAHREHDVAGIDVSHLELSRDAVSPVSIILSDLGAGTRTILLTKGRNTTLAPEQLDWDWLQQARIVHLDGHQMDASLAVAARARDWPGTTLMLDAGSMRDGMVELGGLCDIVIASQRFARELTDSEEPRDCVNQLLNMGARIAGVTLGSEGSLCSDHTETVKQGAFAVETCDTTGAGDAYHGGFIYGRLQGWPLAQCMQYASAVAALKCTGIGARECLPSRRQVQEFILRRAESG